MFMYEKRLQYPVKIKTPNPKLAKAIITQYGGPHGELGASLRYLSQRFSMPYPEVKAVLTDIGTEELGHLEMVGTIVYQLTRNLTPEQIKAAGFDDYFVDHTTGVYPVAASGTPFSANTIAVTGDPLADLHEDLAADATTAKEHRYFRWAENPWYDWLFGTLKVFVKMAYLQSYKNNLTANHTNFYIIHGRTSCFREIKSSKLRSS